MELQTPCPTNISQVTVTSIFVMESSQELPDAIYEETTSPAHFILQVNGVSVAINQYSYHSGHLEQAPFFNLSPKSGYLPTALLSWFWSNIVPFGS